MPSQKIYKDDKTPGVRDSKSPAMRYIKRVDEKGQHAWKVCFNRYGQEFHKYFSDSLHGGNRSALKAARAFRDKSLMELPQADYKMWRCQVPKARKGEGPIGVSRHTTKRNGKLFLNWQAYWRDIEGKRHSKTFSIDAYGEEQAKSMALEARQNGLAELRRAVEAKEQNERRAYEARIALEAAREAQKAKDAKASAKKPARKSTREI